MGVNTIFQTLKGSLLNSHLSDLAEITTHVSFNACSQYLKVFKVLDWNKQEKVETSFSAL